MNPEGTLQPFAAPLGPPTLPSQEEKKTEGSCAPAHLKDEDDFSPEYLAEFLTELENYKSPPP